MTVTGASRTTNSRAAAISMSPSTTNTHNNVHAATRGSFANFPPLVVEAYYGFRAVRENELSLSAGMKVDVLFKQDDGWWYGKAGDKEGYFPGSYVREIMITHPHAVADLISRTSATFSFALPASTVNSYASSSQELLSSSSTPTPSPILSPSSSSSSITSAIGAIGATAGRLANAISSRSSPTTAAAASAIATVIMPASAAGRPTQPNSTSTVSFQGPNPRALSDSRSSTASLNDFKDVEKDWFISIDELTWGQCIGSGAFGAVHMGTWRGKEVAIKWLMPPGESEEDIQVAQDLCRKEAEFLLSCQHINVIEFKGACLEFPNSFLVMDFAKQGSLFNYIRKHKAEAIPPKQLIDWALDIAYGMQYLSEKEPPVVHRDLKSQNVLVGNDGKLKISDFGVARHLRSIASKNTTAGTFAWMAPESIREQRYSIKSDVWSFGVILWEMLTGEQPYRDMEPFAIAYGVATLKLKLPIPDTCPTQLKQLMLSCWNEKPDDRPNFSKILSSLQNLQGSQFISTPPASYNDMRESWKPQIDRMFSSLQTMEQTFKEKEEELRRADRERLQREATLLSKEEQLKRREEELQRNEEELKMREALIELGQHDRSLSPTERRLSNQRSQQHSRSTSNPEKRGNSPVIDISAPFNFKHVAHVGPHGQQFDMTKLEPDWRSIIKQAGISESEMSYQDAIDFLMRFAVQFGEPYDHVQHMLVNTSTGRDSFHEGVTHQRLYDELQLRLTEELRETFRTRDITNSPRKSVDLRRDLRVTVYPRKIGVGERVCVLWSGHHNARLKDWIGIIPKGGKNRDAVAVNFLNAQTYGMATFTIKARATYDVRLIDRDGKTILTGETIEVTIVPRRKRSVSWATSLDAPATATAAVTATAQSSYGTSSTVPVRRHPPIGSRSSETDLRRVAFNTDVRNDSPPPQLPAFTVNKLFSRR